MASDVVSRKRLAREKSLPEIPRSLGEEAIASLGAMREQVERLSGKSGEASDRAVRLFEVEMGLLSAFVPTGVDVARNATPGGGGLRILKAPRGLQYEHLIFGIRLTWENVEPRHSAVEIWCAEDSLLLDDAWRVGVATKPMSEWTMHGISMRINYTFWIRAVDWAGGVSPWCPAQGQGGLVVPAQIDTTVSEVLDVLTGRVTNSQLHQALSSKIDMIDGHTAAIQEQAEVIDGLEAQWFVKLDVDGRVAGVGLHGTGATSEFIVLADKFMVVTPGTNPKVPFVVGPLGETGETGVGIDGGLVVNGSIRARHLDAGSVTADKIGANQISGQHIAATSDIILSEGGTLTVGQNNIMLDSLENELLIAPDNGTVVGAPNLSGHNYCVLRDGDVNFMYWDGQAHVLYNSLKRIEVGLGVQNGVEVTLPGVWKHEPKVIVSPANIPSYNKNYPTANQSIVCGAESIEQVGLTYKFTPKAYLALSDGIFTTNPGLSIAQTGMVKDTWYYFTTAVRTTQDYVSTIILSGSAWASAAGDGCNDYCTLKVWMYVDGVETYLGSWYERFPSISINKTISLASGVHQYYFKVGYNWDYEGDGCLKASSAQLRITSETVYLSNFTQLVSGTLNFMAIGE